MVETAAAAGRCTGRSAARAGRGPEPLSDGCSNPEPPASVCARASSSSASASTAQLAHHSRVVLQSHDQRRVIRTVRFLLDRQRPAQQRLGLDVDASIVLQQRQVVQADRQLRVVGAKAFSSIGSARV